MPQNVTIQFTTRSVMLLLTAVAAVWFLVVFDQLVVLLFVAALLAIAIDPTVSRLERRHVPRWLATTLVYLLLLGGVGLVSGLLVPVLIVELSQLSARLPVIAQQSAELFQRWLAARFPGLGTTLSASDVAQRLSSQLGDLITSAGDLLLVVGSAFGTIVIDTLLVLVVAFLLSTDTRFMSRVIGRFFPPRYRSTTTDIAKEIGQRLGHWVRAQALVGLFFGVAFGLGLAVLGIPYWFSLAVAAAVFEFIPYIGGMLVTAIAMLVALTIGPWLPLAVLGMYLVVASIESNIVYPKLMGDIVGLHPLVVIVALFIGAGAKGVLGALLAIPVTVVVQVILDHVYRFDQPAPSILPPD